MYVNIVFTEGKLDSEPEEEILSDEPETDLEDDEEDDEDERLYKEKRRKIKNVFVEEEAEDSDQDNFEDESEEDSEMQTKSGSNADKQRNAETSSEKTNNKQDSHDDMFTSRSELKLNLKVNFQATETTIITNTRFLQSSGLFSSLEDLTPNLDDDTSESLEESLIPKLKSTQTTDSSNVDELLALCSGKFPGKLSSY